jgi:TolB-like protein/class 3 adenylate cyclase
MPPVRRLTAILAADVAGYSRLMGADEEGTHERLKAHLRELVDPKIAEHRGRVVKNTGDGFLAEFQSVVDAVRCAVEVQRNIIERNAAIPPEKRIEFRIGVNLGDIIAEQHDIFGDGVNVAARLEALAEPGGICISRVVRDQIRDKLPYPFEDWGEQSVKNIARPVRLFALRPETVAELPLPGVPVAAPRRPRGIVAPMGAGVATVLVVALIAWWLWPAMRTSSTPASVAAAATSSIAQPLVAPRLSIVVLPFSNLSDDREQQYFADGVTEDLTTDLSRIQGSFVISRNTAFTYKDKAVNAKQIGRDLGVRYVLEGSVRRSGNHIRVNAQLIDAETDAHLWAERFDRDTGDLLILQSEITDQISAALNVKMVAVEAARPIAHPDTLDYILRGRAAFSKPRSRDNLAEAINQFERALALDPRSVEAQSRLSITLAARVLDFPVSTSDVDIKRAGELATQAATESPRSTLAHFAKAQVLRVQGRCDEAIPEYEAVLALNRNWVGALADIGRCKIFVGPIEEAIPLLERAIRLSPRDPGIAWWYARIGQAHLLQSRIDEAILWLEKANTANAGLWYVHAYLASTCALKGDIERAAAELTEAKKLVDDDRFSSMVRLKAAGYSGSNGYWGVPKVRALFEATYFAGLRKAGMPEE